MVIILYLKINMIFALTQDDSALQHIQNICFNISHMMDYFIFVFVVATMIYPNGKGAGVN